MSLATLYNIPNPDDWRTFAEFSFSNMDQHRIITEAIFAKKGINIPSYVLDPMPLPNDPAFEAWLQIHQTWHTSINGILDVAGVDLTSVDFRDPEQAVNWQRLHASEHIQWQDKLGTN